VTGVAFSPDGTLLATASMDGTAMLWEVPSGALVHTLTADKSSLFAVAFSPDGTYLAAGSVHTTRLWEVPSGALGRTLTGFGHGTAVAFNPDGTLLATASNDKTARLWG
jgi:WD40 repeat protein